MEVKTFEGPTPKEALKKAINIYGEDNIRVLESKQIIKKSLTNPALYEVVVVIDKDKKAKTIIPKMPPQDQSVILDISKKARQISKIVEDDNIDTMLTKKNNIQDLKNKSNLDGILKDIKKEINKFGTNVDKINENVNMVLNSTWENSPAKVSRLPIPPEFSEIYRITKRSKMKEEHLNELMIHTFENMPNSMKEHQTTVKRYFKTVLRKLIPTRMENKPQSPYKKIISLVGSTGVGKTTTIAKLAARYLFKFDRKYKVGLISLDSYKISADSQLEYYAKTMKLNIEKASDYSQISRAIERFSTYDYILIDTIGISPIDKEKLEVLKNCINNKSEFDFQTSLVIPAGLSYEDMNYKYKAFNELNIDNVIFTKLDETKWFGSMFSFLYDIKKPVSYICIGQEVPEDLLTADKDYLVDCILEGFKGNYKNL